MIQIESNMLSWSRFSFSFGKYSFPEAHCVSVGKPPLPTRIWYEPGVPASAAKYNIILKMTLQFLKIHYTAISKTAHKRRQKKLYAYPIPMVPMQQMNMID
jgi:hypothetical protein